MAGAFWKASVVVLLFLIWWHLYHNRDRTVVVNSGDGRCC